MRKFIIPILLVLFGLNTLTSQTTQQDKGDVIVLLSSHTTADRLDQFTQDLQSAGIIFEVKEVTWESPNQLSKISFSLQTSSTHKRTKHEFKYNDLNKSNLFMISKFANSTGSYGMIMADMLTFRVSLWPEFKTGFDENPKKLISTFHDPVAWDATEDYIFLFKNLYKHFATTIDLLKEIRHDREFATKDHYNQYYYNGNHLADSFTISTADMDSNVEIKYNNEGQKSIYMTSEKPISPNALLADK